MKTTTTLALATSILAVQANASLFDFFSESGMGGGSHQWTYTSDHDGDGGSLLGGIGFPEIRPPSIHHTAIDTADHRHGFLNSISAQKHTMVATGVGGCFDEPGKPCVQKSGGVITVAVAAPYDGTPAPPSSSFGSDEDGGDGVRGYDSSGNYVGNIGEYDQYGSYNPGGGLAGSSSVGGGWGSDGQNETMGELGF